MFNFTLYLNYLISSKTLQMTNFESQIFIFIYETMTVLHKFVQETKIVVKCNYRHNVKNYTILHCTYANVVRRKETGCFSNF